jgi:hypothetical protein
MLVRTEPRGRHRRFDMLTIGLRSLVWKSSFPGGEWKHQIDGGSHAQRGRYRPKHPASLTKMIVNPVV